MMQGREESWSMALDISDLMHVALYVRDTFRLPAGDGLAVPPPLDGGVLDRSVASDAEWRRRAGSQWRSWWGRILQLEGAKALRTLRLPEGVDPLQAMPAVHARLFDWPTLDALASWPELREAARESRDGAVRWAGERKRLLVERRPLMTRAGNAPVIEIAEHILHRSAVAPGFVRGAIFLLEVQGVWSTLVSPGVLLCSSPLARDAGQMASLVEQALTLGVHAEEVGIEHEPRRRVPPPSVLLEPLVLWRRGDASVTCERVIPYEDGFEVELRHRGLGAPVHQWRPGRGRFTAFAGLQVRLRYADGREELLDDVERLDREGPIAITTFTRGPLGGDSLWLWVMPLPSPGEVRLTVEWPAQGIEPVTVSLDGTTIRPQ